jgi:hypothetical protein
MWGAMKGIEIARTGLVAAGLMAAALTSAAEAQEGELVKGLLGSLGVIQEDKDPIDYRERAPLVLPPRMELREPAAPGSVQARSPQWPNDPDAASRKRREIADRTPLTQTEGYRMDVGKDTRLTVHEMRAGRHAGAGIPTTPQAPRSAENAWIHPDVLRAQHRGSPSAPGTGDEATRRSLTDPPSAYRRSATGGPIRSSWEAPSRVDEADPKVFHRQQQQRNQ